MELRAIRRVAEEEKEEKEERVAEQRASSNFEFDKNDPNLLRRKIEDLQVRGGFMVGLRSLRQNDVRCKNVKNTIDLYYY